MENKSPEKEAAAEDRSPPSEAKRVTAVRYWLAESPNANVNRFAAVVAPLRSQMKETRHIGVSVEWNTAIAASKSPDFNHGTSMFLSPTRRRLA